jgi:hypothetical protein
LSVLQLGLISSKTIENENKNTFFINPSALEVKQI